MDAETLMIVVANILDEAGFQYAIHGGPSKRPGYSIRQLSNDSVSIHSETDNPVIYSRGIELALALSGLTVSRPFSDPNTLRVF